MFVPADAGPAFTSGRAAPRRSIPSQTSPGCMRSSCFRLWRSSPRRSHIRNRRTRTTTKWPMPVPAAWWALPRTIHNGSGLCSKRNRAPHGRSASPRRWSELALICGTSSRHPHSAPMRKRPRWQSLQSIALKVSWLGSLILPVPHQHYAVVWSVAEASRFSTAQRHAADHKGEKTFRQRPPGHTPARRKQHKAGPAARAGPASFFRDGARLP